MRKFYRKFETAWCARQLGRSVYSVRYKAVDLNISKAKPSVWKGNKGPANTFKTQFATPTKKTRKTTTRRNTTKTWRANTKKRTTGRKNTTRKTRKTR